MFLPIECMFKKDIGIEKKSRKIGSSSLCSFIFLVLRNHGFILFKFENRVPLMH